MKARVFVTLKPFEQRNSPGLSGMAIAGKLQKKYGAIGKAKRPGPHARSSNTP